MTLSESETLTDRIDALPPTERALLMGVAAKQPYEEIANAVGIAPTSVGVAVMQAFHNIGLGKASHEERVSRVTQALQERIAFIAPAPSSSVVSLPPTRSSHKTTAASLTASVDIPSAQSVAKRIPFLTTRLREVLGILVEDLTYEAKVAKLGVAENSVSSYFSILSKKLEILGLQRELRVRLMKEAYELYCTNKTHRS